MRVITFVSVLIVEFLSFWALSYLLSGWLLLLVGIMLAWLFTCLHDQISRFVEEEYYE